jgi:orotate phosphoribosyltransferase
MSDPITTLLSGRRGHFKMESGYHSEFWYDLDALFASPQRLRPYISALAKRLAAHRPDAVCGPMTGGAKLAEMIAGELGLAYYFTERVASPEAKGLFPVDYRLPAARRASVRGKSVAIVDDAISAGSAVRASSARPVALGALLVFGDGAGRFAADAGLALESVAQVAFGIWPPAECPHCRAGRPVEEVSA